LPNTKIWLFAIAAGVAGLATAMAMRRRSSPREAGVAAVVVAIPLLAPLLILGIAPVVSWASVHLGIPVHFDGYGFEINRDAADDHSSFGAIGAYALIAAPLTILLTRRRDRRLVVLAVAMPLYMVILGTYAAYNIWLTRFLVVPVALVAPIFAVLLRNRLASLTVLLVAATSVFYSLAYDNAKPGLGRAAVYEPWTLSQPKALAESPAEPTGRNASAALVAYDRIVPTTACVGAVLDPDEWSYPLWGSHFGHKLYFLPSDAALATAENDNLRYVIVSTGANAPVADAFTAAGWSRRSLGGYWTLVTAPGTVTGCPAAA
jgi:hypothetical protein